MREFIKYALLVINIVSLVIGLVVTLYFFYCEFFGYIKGDNFLRSIHSPLDTDGVFTVGFICVAINPLLNKIVSWPIGVWGI